MLRLAAILLFLGFAQPGAAHAREIVLVELFTSQGCASCMRANRLMGRIAEDPDVLALTFSVDYWDYLGWRDTFAHAEFTDRQRAYARTLRARMLFTPQFVFDGALRDSGSDEERVRQLIEERRAETHDGGPDIALVQRQRRGMTVFVGAGPNPGEEPADVWIAIYDPGPRIEVVRTGENAGRRVPHFNVVLRLRKIGEWNGAPRSYDGGSCRPACAVLVQRPGGGIVLAAAHSRPDRGSTEHERETERADDQEAAQRR